MRAFWSFEPPVSSSRWLEWAISGPGGGIGGRMAQYVVEIKGPFKGRQACFEIFNMRLLMAFWDLCDTHPSFSMEPGVLEGRGRLKGAALKSFLEQHQGFMPLVTPREGTVLKGDPLASWVRARAETMTGTRGPLEVDDVDIEWLCAHIDDDSEYELVGWEC